MASTGLLEYWRCFHKVDDLEQLTSLGPSFPVYKMELTVVPLIRPVLRTGLTQEPVRAFTKCWLRRIAVGNCT